MSKLNLRGRISLGMLFVLIIGGCAGHTPHEVDQPLAPRADADPEAAEDILEGNRLFAEHQWEAAIKQYEAAINAQSSAAEAHYNLGLTLNKQGRYSDSRPHFIRAAKLEPRHPVIRNAPPFRQYGHGETDSEDQASDGDYGHQH